MSLNNFSAVDASVILEVAEKFGTPCYLYDEGLIIAKCKAVSAMPSAFGLTVRYAMKANSNRSVLRTISGQGILTDASSLNEVKRAYLAGIGYDKIILTTQEVPEGDERAELEQMILDGLKYNVCSLRQLSLIGDFAYRNKIDLSIRIHPGVGSGESATRNTGDNYSCFGVHLSDIDKALKFAEEKQLRFTQVHTHIGSGADPVLWQQNIDLELDILERYFPHADTISFGGGLKESRMPGECSADIAALGSYAKQRIEEFFGRTGRKLKMEVEPGTFIVANSGYAITKIIDKKSTGGNGMNFVVVNGGMEVNARPLLYGSSHPFYVVSKAGELLSSEFNGKALKASKYKAAVVGRCCETGDSQCLDSFGNNHTRYMAEPELDDYLVIGAVGAYCSSMTPFNYNSHTQIAEALLTQAGELRLIRRPQSLAQIVENEV